VFSYVSAVKVNSFKRLPKPT